MIANLDNIIQHSLFAHRFSLHECRRIWRNPPPRTQLIIDSPGLMGRFMKKSRFTESQIIAVLKEGEAMQRLQRIFLTGAGGSSFESLELRPTTSELDAWHGSYLIL